MTKPTNCHASDTSRMKGWPTARILTAVSAVLWLFMALDGISVIDGIRNQHVPGYPNDGQRRLYVVIPLLGFAASAGIVCFAKWLPSLAKRIGMGISIFALLAVFLIGGGGI
jgi:hypothetical protein